MIGETISHYRVLERLGAGGMGEVYLAEDFRLHRRVALKMLRPEVHRDEEARARLLREARAASALNHPNIAVIYEIDERQREEGPVPFIAMEYVAGRTLGEMARLAAPTLDFVLDVARQIAEALTEAHGRGIVHRDVKPSNVIIDETGSANLTDFGLAKGRAYTVLTKPGMVMGTLDYLAPELLRGSEATGASDIYALGCLAYECTAGRAPFADTSMFDLASAHLNVVPPDPCANRPDAPEGLSWAILQALAKDPGGRPPTATAYAHLISFAAGGRAPSPSPPAPSPP
jgi:serine/threonine protein kinase